MLLGYSTLHANLGNEMFQYISVDYGCITLKKKKKNKENSLLFVTEHERDSL